MARSYASWDGFNSLMAVLAWTADPDLSELCAELEDVIADDNRRGVLAGQDRDGAPMLATVREGTPVGHWVTYRLPDGRPAHYFQAGRSPSPGAPPGVSEGAGPPLAPRFDASRVIANLKTGWTRNGAGEWTVFGTWENVLSDKGVSFLPFHFQGEGKLPVRDLAGLRPEGLADAQEVIDLWVDAQMNARFQQG